MSDDTTALAKVYAAKSAEELADAYAAWSNDYDRETAQSGYCLPFMITSWVARYVAKGDGPILDAGCGTGLSGPYMQALGYPMLEGLDLSEKMLTLAAGRGSYRTLEKAALGGALPWPDGYFAAVFSAGVFTEGHAPASSLAELVRITRTGGHLIFTVRDVVLEAGGFRSRFRALEKSRRWQAIEESPLFRAFAVAEPEVLGQVFVFKVL